MQCSDHFDKEKVQGSSIDEKMINKRPGIIKEPKVINKWWTAINTYNINDISMANKVPEMELQKSTLDQWQWGCKCVDICSGYRRDWKCEMQTWDVLKTKW